MKIKSKEMTKKVNKLMVLLWETLNASSLRRLSEKSGARKWTEKFTVIKLVFFYVGSTDFVMRN